MSILQTKPSLYRDFALLSLLIVFILMLVSVWVSYETYRSHSEKILRQLENEAVHIDRALIVEIEKTSYILESIARQISLSSDYDERNILQLLQSFDKEDYPQNSHFFWINQNQEILLGSREGMLEKPMNVSDRDYMKKALTSPWQVHIGHPIEGRISGKWVMPLALGITDEDNHFRGAISISLDIGAFSRELHNVIKEPGVSFAITNNALTLLTEISEQRDFFSRYFALEKLAEIDFDKTHEGIYSQGNLFDPNSIFSYFERSSQFPYIIFVGYDSAMSAGAIRTILLPKLFQIFVIALFLLSVLWMVRKRIIQPVITLTKDTQGIIRGEGIRRLHHSGPAEIERLARAIYRLNDYIEECKRTELEMQSKNAELLKIRESAELTNEIKAAFFEQVGHALMQPATGIRECSESFTNELFGPLGSKKYNEMSAEINQYAEHILALLSDILAISKAETGLLALNDSAVDVPFILQKCVRLLHDRTRFASIDVIQDIEPELPRLIADELRLKQLILNLLMGAASQIASGDTIRISAMRGRHELCLQLNYKLAEALRQPHLYNQPPVTLPFATAKSVKEESEFTHGLGMALSQLIVAMHGGELDLRQNNDYSITIIVSFPADRVVEE